MTSLCDWDIVEKSDVFCRLRIMFPLYSRIGMEFFLTLSAAHVSRGEATTYVVRERSKNCRMMMLFSNTTVSAREIVLFIV